MTEGARKQDREVGGISIRSASWLAWSLCALSLALTALSYLVTALDLSLDAPVYFYWLEPTTIAIEMLGIKEVQDEALQDTIREYALERLRSSGEAELTAEIASTSPFHH